MNNRPPRDKTPSEPGKTSSNSLLDDIMKGEIMVALPRAPTPDDIDKMMTGARPRFAPNALMTISALKVDHLLDNTRDRMRTAFTEFRVAGGTLIVVVTENPVVASLFRSIANHTHIAIKIARDLKESKEYSEKHRGVKHPPKP